MIADMSLMCDIVDLGCGANAGEERDVAGHSRTGIAAAADGKPPCHTDTLRPLQCNWKVSFCHF